MLSTNEIVSPTDKAMTDIFEKVDRMNDNEKVFDKKQFEEEYKR